MRAADDGDEESLPTQQPAVPSQVANYMYYDSFGRPCAEGQTQPVATSLPLTLLDPVLVLTFKEFAEE